MHAHHIALIGVNSRIGPAILQALLEHPSKPHIVIFLRPTSHPAPTHPRIRTVTIPSDPPTLHDLTSALNEHDIESLVSALSPADRETQITLADACVAAGVYRYIPADYGSMRSDDPYVLDLLPNFRNKKLVREHCQALARKHKSFTWTSLASGHFFDYGLRTELLGINEKENSAMLFDGGKDRFSTSTVKQIGKAVAAIVLDKEEETANQMLLIQSFCVSQLEIIKAMDEVKGRRPVKGVYVESEGFIEEKAAEAKKGDAEAVEELVAVLGIKRSNWTGDKLFANELLGLKEENLRDVVHDVLG
ncbi:uncharacterized protein MKK02DRAFT_21370 [Dioszegia hungarica]|uniref:NmrA-like domain-containing protein n=1 Tax=Dioszegia hungarica TaxID=4972 RepID=A0AA38GZK6_9TREE|nr:uncharacterized protein MKK02DRAFT_21370 [Dioszegia hungarica]KAI9631727.1 hypothetical protein MKK02DRAFT_21370 [Dioszegia hungarica]